MRLTNDLRGRTRAVALLAPALLVAAGLAACGGSSSGSAGSTGKPQTVTIGLIAPLSGPAAPAYSPLIDGAKAAIAYLDGGKAQAKGVTYKLDVRDSGADPNKDAVLVRALAGEGVGVVVGDIGSAPGFIAEQTTLNKDNLLGFTSAPNNEIWKSAGDSGAYPWAFGISGDDQMFVTPEYKAAAAETTNGKIAQLYLDYGSPGGWATLASGLAKQDGKSLTTASFPVTATDVKAQLRQLQASGADTLIIWSYGATLQTALADLGQIGWYPKIVTMPDAARSSLQQAVPAKVMSNVIAGPITTTFVSSDGSAPTGIVADYLAAMTKVTGRGSGQYGQADISGAYTFDILLAYDAGVAKAGSTDSAKVRQALESGLQVTGAMGTHTWSAASRSGLAATSFAVFNPSESCGKGTCVATQQ
jgi:ABC-type branched-subunit amino acid transport system substrate-binding protein